MAYINGIEHCIKKFTLVVSDPKPEVQAQSIKTDIKGNR